MSCLQVERCDELGRDVATFIGARTERTLIAILRASDGATLLLAHDRSPAGHTSAGQRTEHDLPTIHGFPRDPKQGGSTCMDCGYSAFSAATGLIAATRRAGT
jgi:hypothetical protein